jgi:hypothetical protein
LTDGAGNAGLLRFACDRLEGVIVNENVAGIVARALGGASRDKPPWWYVTDLVNPSLAFYREVSPPIPTDPAIAQRLRYGRAIHDAAESWFRCMENYAASEGSVDGAHIGVNGVRGRIDFRIGDSIVELKTTERRTIDVGTLFSVYPHDLEQLVLYALFTTREDEPHRLVYYRTGVEPPFVSFKVRLRRPGPLKHAFEQRLKLLDEALAKRDPSRLGRCCYLESGCDYDLQHVCGCRTASRVDDSHLRDSLEVRPDPTFDAELEAARQQARRRGLTGLSLWDLFVPRQAYLKSTGAGVPYYADDDERTAIRRQMLDGVRNSGLNYEGRPIDLDGVHLGWSEFVTLRETGRDGPTANVYPILVKASSVASPFRRDGLPDAYVAQAGVRCALWGTNSALLIVGYSGRPGLLACYRLSFRDTDGILAEVRRSLREIAWAVSHSDPSHLGPCESWLTSSCAERCLCREGSIAR